MHMPLNVVNTADGATLNAVIDGKTVAVATLQWEASDYGLPVLILRLTEGSKSGIVGSRFMAIHPAKPQEG